MDDEFTDEKKVDRIVFVLYQIKKHLEAINESLVLGFNKMVEMNNGNMDATISRLEFDLNLFRKLREKHIGGKVDNEVDKHCN